jgi:endonuclease I
MKLRREALRQIRSSYVRAFFFVFLVIIPPGCVNLTEGYQGEALLAADLSSGCYVTSSDHKSYWLGVDACKSNESLKAELQKRLRNHRNIPYTNNSSVLTGLGYYTKNFMLLNNSYYAVPERFDVWDAFTMFAMKNANAYNDGTNCTSGKLLDWYDYRCYDTPTEIMTVNNGGQQGSSGSDTLSAATANFGSEGIYNREHSWPKSWFLAGAASGYCASDKDGITNEGTAPYDYRAYVDLHHLIPARASVNSSRGNNSFGVVAAASANYPRTNGAKSGTPDTGAMSGYPGTLDAVTTTLFEPPNGVKGALARIYFYMATRYYTEDGCWLSNNAVTRSNINTWLENLLRQWHNDYPVSEGERLRNDWIQRIQGNRNPFVDHPEWVAKIADF